MRPTARRALEIVQKRRSLVLRRTGADSESDTGNPKEKANNCHSALYFFDVAKTSLSPVSALPVAVRVKHVNIGIGSLGIVMVWLKIAISDRHQVLVTSEKLVYAWGDNRHGQLGLGDRRSRSQPTLVDGLTGKSIIKVAVGTTVPAFNRPSPDSGSRFSVFCAESGVVMICGHRRFTGIDKQNDDLLKPKLMDSLLRSVSNVSNYLIYSSASISST